MIAHEVVQQYCSTIIVKSGSGERLTNIWRKVYWLTDPNDRHATDRRTQRQVQRMPNIFNARYAFTDEVPTFLQVCHKLREEGRDAYYKVASARLAHAETENKFDRNCCKFLANEYLLTYTLNTFEKLSGGPITATDEMVMAEWYRMQRQGVVMVCNALRWHALRRVCRVLELYP
jgi:hypothetical protein